VVYEGIFPYTQTEAGLAIVLGHEIAHAVAMHSAEQYSTQLRQQYGAQILGGVLSAAGAGSATTAIAGNVYGLGAKATSLKYSRDNESEADHMGLIFAAMAGYDPNEAVTFWTRMASGNNGNTSTFWSTHPSDQQRIADIKRALPQALRYYKPVPQTIVIKSTENTTQTKSTSKKKSSSTKKKSTRKKK
jgi:predicted Zn-dependent protease